MIVVRHIWDELVWRNNSGVEVTRKNIEDKIRWLMRDLPDYDFSKTNYGLEVKKDGLLIFTLPFGGRLKKEKKGIVFNFTIGASKTLLF